MNSMKYFAAAILFLAAISLKADNSDLQIRAQKLHDKIISVDTHTDSALYLPREDRDPSTIQVTFDKMRIGRLDCCFLPIYISQGEVSDEGRAKAFSYVNGKMDAIQKFIADHSGEAEIAYTPDDVVRLKKSGKLSCVMGLENGYPIGLDLSRVEYFYNRGARIITLCHNHPNDICDSATDTLKPYHGLSDFGYKVLDEMNRLGIIVDISHASSETLYDCLEASRTPVIASHSCVHAIKAIARNLTDEEIRAIADKGGVVQVTTGRWALSNAPKPEVNLATFCDHADYIKNLVGADYVGIGTDFDGGGGMVGFENCSKMKDITVELMRRGWSDEELEKFWGGNILRVWRQVESYAASLR